MASASDLFIYMSYNNTCIHCVAFVNVITPKKHQTEGIYMFVHTLRHIHNIQ